MPIDPFTAFVSYSREDLEFVRRLAKDLKPKGAKVWMDKLDIRAGQRWESRVEVALNACSRMLVIVSSRSIASQNVLAEAAYAIDEGKEVIPVVIQECRIPFRLRPFQYADFRTDYALGLEELLASLSAEGGAAADAIAEQTRLEDERKRAEPDEPRRKQGKGKRERRAAEEKQSQEEFKGQRKAPKQTQLQGQRRQADKHARLKQRRNAPTRQARLEKQQHKQLKEQTRRAPAEKEATETPGREFLVTQTSLTLRGHNDAVFSVALSPDGKWLATASEDKTARVWDAASGRELPTLRSHDYDVVSVAWSPDGKRLATASYDQTAKVWDAATGQELQTLRDNDHLNIVAWSPDGKRLATGSKDHTAKLWDGASGQELLTLRGHNDTVMSFGLEPGRQAHGDGELRPHGESMGRGDGQGSADHRHVARCVQCSLSPDGNQLLETGGYGNTVKVHTLKLY